MTTSFEYPDSEGSGANQRGLIDLIGDHNLRQIELQELLKGIIHNPDGIAAPNTADALSVTANDILTAWRRIIRNLLQSNGATDGFVKSVATLLMEDEVKRAVFLNEEIGDEKFSPIHEGDIRLLEAGLTSFLDAIADRVEESEKPTEIVNAFSTIYAGCIESDVDKLQTILGAAQYRRSQARNIVEAPSWQARAKYYCQKFCRHALDITKIAAGVGIGVAIGTRLGRK